MKKMDCYAPCGFTQLCMIACPNNRVLDQYAMLVCSSTLQSVDDGEPMQIEFDAGSGRTRRREDIEP